MVRFCLGDYHHLRDFTYTKTVRGDNLNTQVIKNEKGKINIIFNDSTQRIPVKHRDYTRELPAFKIIEDHFSCFIGLESIKNIVKEIYALKMMNDKRSDMALTINKQVLHMIFKGNPGTGKTSVARELGKLLFKLNILSKGHFVEAERADIVGEYVGQTAQKTRAIVQKALGGVLFIDEAYSLNRGGKNDFGREAIDTLVKQMEDHHNEFVLILAGYPHEMNCFNVANPGLESRFPFHIAFKDYSINQLIEIAKQMASEREYELTKGAINKLHKHLDKISLEMPADFSNARYIRNLIEKSIRLQAMRLLHNQTYGINDLIFINSDDIRFD